MRLHRACYLAVSTCTHTVEKTHGHTEQAAVCNQGREECPPTKNQTLVACSAISDLQVQKYEKICFAHSRPPACVYYGDSSEKIQLLVQNSEVPL